MDIRLHDSQITSKNSNNSLQSDPSELVSTTTMNMSQHNMDAYTLPKSPQIHETTLATTISPHLSPSSTSRSKALESALQVSKHTLAPPVLQSDISQVELEMRSSPSRLADITSSTYSPILNKDFLPTTLQPGFHKPTMSSQLPFPQSPTLSKSPVSYHSSEDSKTKSDSPGIDDTRFIKTDDASQQRIMHTEDENPPLSQDRALEFKPVRTQQFPHSMFAAELHGIASFPTEPKAVLDYDRGGAKVEEEYVQEDASQVDDDAFTLMLGMNRVVTTSQLLSDTLMASFPLPPPLTQSSNFFDHNGDTQ